MCDIDFGDIVIIDIVIIDRLIIEILDFELVVADIDPTKWCLTITNCLSNYLIEWFYLLSTY